MSTRALLRFLTAGFLTPLLFVGCGGQDRAVDVPPPVVTVTPAVKREVRDWDEYTGRLVAQGIVDIRPQVSGYLTEVKFQDGDLVKKGEPLFIIDSRPYQAEYNRAKGEYDKAESTLKLASSDYERAKQLRDKGVTAAGDFDKASSTLLQAQGAVQSAKAALDSAALNVEFCTISSPIDGRASLANVTVGNLVSPSMDKPLTTVVSIDPIYAYADVDERSLLRYSRYYKAKNVQPGDEEKVKLPVQLALQDEKDFPRTGYIDFMDNRVDPDTGTIKMRGVFENDGIVAPGLFARVRIPAGDLYEAVLIPPRAVATDQQQKYVFVVGPDNIARRVNVELGRVNNGEQVVTSGLEAGQNVVVDGLLKVRAGETVDPKLVPAATPAPEPTNAP